MRPVPLVDLAWQHREIEQDLLPQLLELMASGAFIQGPQVASFEREFADFSGARHCIGVGNGTDALELALQAVRIESGAGVILPANTFFATAEAVVRSGARPVLVDCDELALIDPQRVADRLDGTIRAVIPVHLYGQIAGLEELTDLLQSRGIAVVEDAAQAQGATRHGRGIGSFGAVAATSFYPGKNLGAYGDAGAVLTDSDEMAARVRRLANHGSDTKYLHRDVGCNSRLDTIQAVVLRAKLSRLHDWNAARREAAARYDELLSPLEKRGLLVRPLKRPGNVHVWHLYVVRISDRDTVLDALQARGIGAGVHYPVPVHLQTAFRSLGHRVGDFPVAERLAGESLSLPMYPGLATDVQERVVDELTAVLEGEAVRRAG
jgi:dTDP-4-amino-4,6-dideoxygalactose transaminase